MLYTGEGETELAPGHTLDPQAIRSPDPYPWSIPNNDKFYLYQATLVYLCK